MKTSSLLAAATMLLLPALAFARQKDSVQVQFPYVVSVAGTQLAPGHYKLTWQGNGPDVTVSFIEGRKIVATASARLVNEPSSQLDSFETETATDKTVILQAVDMNHESLRFESTASAAGN